CNCKYQFESLTSARVSAPRARLRGQVGPRFGEHRLAGRDLHPLASFGLAEGLLRGLEPVVALPIGVFDTLGFEQFDDRIRVLIHGAGQGTGGLVVEDVADRLQRVSLRVADQPRSEEHTSELQSRFDLVCRLLLEKKNTNADIN